MIRREVGLLNVVSFLGIFGNTVRNGFPVCDGLREVIRYCSVVC